MSAITTLADTSWTGGRPDRPGDDRILLEAGEVLFLPHLPFRIEPQESVLLSPAVGAAAKNISFDARTGRLGGATVDAANRARLQELLARFSSLAADLIRQLFPPYRGRIELGRTSFRPVEIAGRASSWRRDDTRLHVDSFPATPVQGRRILRVFSNVNPRGQPRTWRLGEDFETVARRFASQLRLPWPGSGAVLQVLHVTKSRRSPYDALMLQLHDRMKADTDYQVAASQIQFAFPSGSTWLAFTDQVSHAAMAGQYQLEQTFMLPIAAMLDERRSPLRILERLFGHSLV
jgi:hypothetical protein